MQLMRLLLALTLLTLSRVGMAQGVDAHIPKNLDCKVHPCAEVLPGAKSFQAAPHHKPYQVGLDADGKVAGWVALSTDLVDVKAYSGKPLVTLIGLDPDGVITGVRVISHSEPILLVGIPEKALHDFVAFYTNRRATEKIVVGRTDDPEITSVDIISGATVTALAQNRTILETASALGTGVGAIDARHQARGHFVQDEATWTFKEMWERGALGRLTVTREQMGQPAGDTPFIDLFFAVADAPHIGKGLLGPSEYAWNMAQLKDGEHLLIVLGNGESSFKGSGFVRGGIFDRVRLEQGMRSVLFTDKDYRSLQGVSATDAPAFKEGAVFIVRGGALDPGLPFDLVFVGSVYNHQGGFGRDFKTVTATFSLPDSVYHVDEKPDGASAMWRQAWKNSGYKAWALGALLFITALLFSGRRWLTASTPRLKKIHIGFMSVAVLGVGFGLGVQPSVTQIFTVISGVLGEWRWDLFLSEPLVFLFWIFIVIVSIIWGRGVFCGWLCPYGAMNELSFKIGEKLGLKSYELPEAIHTKLRHLRYVILAVLVGAYLYRPELGEMMAEIEPFKSTFYVRVWTRHLGFIAWWLLLFLSAFVWWRPFCRYLCPLGAGLALLGSFRLSGPYRRNFCQSCTICTKTCEPKAIDKNGIINPRECLSCMECEANFRDVEVCPPLIGIDRLLKKGAPLPGTHDHERLDKLRAQEARR